MKAWIRQIPTSKRKYESRIARRRSINGIEEKSEWAV